MILYILVGSLFLENTLRSLKKKQRLKNLQTHLHSILYDATENVLCTNVQELSFHTKPDDYIIYLRQWMNDT
jgi:hypothetical protein